MPTGSKKVNENCCTFAVTATSLPVVVLVLIETESTAHTLV